MSFSVLLLGVQLLGSSVQKIFHPDEVNLLAVRRHFVCGDRRQLMDGAVLPEGGKRISSTALMANSTDSINDVYATAAVLVSTILGKLTGWQLDGYAGTLVALFIFVSGIGLVRETLNPLLGAARQRN